MVARNSPPDTTKIDARGYNMHFNNKPITDIKDFDQARTNVAYTYLCRMIARKNNL